MSNSWFPPSRPLPTTDGLKARTSRGSIGTSWWSKRFVAVLEDIGVGNRLERGRRYARQGQVMSMEITPGSVTAPVQGSRRQPYRVRIGIRPFDKQQWAAVEAALTADAWYCANLLDGQMPDDIEDIFVAVGLSLFPTRASEFSMDCSCPDHEVPCKHIAAAFYLLAETFDDDPFTILAWRGRDRGELLANLHAARADAGPAADHVDQAEPAGRPLTDCLDSYYESPSDVVSGNAPVASSLALLDRLPEIDVAFGGRSLPEILRPAYEAFAEPRGR